MKTIKRKRITIGDNSRTQWLNDEVRTLRKGAALEPGEVVLVRFKEDVSTSGYVPYRVTGWTYRDEFDRAVDRRQFVLRKEEEPA